MNRGDALVDGEPTLPVAEDDASTDVNATFGRFVACGLLGRGGMGVVLRARDPELARDVALKVLTPALAGERGVDDERFLREAQAMARLQHPNVVTVYETGHIGRDRFIAMELVEGTTLAHWLRARPRPWRELVAAFVACGRGLEAAHQAGLVHRDFKADNVLIGADGRPRVSDFGLVTTGLAVDARDLEQVPASVGHLTIRGAALGTPAYMAPEQWLGTAIDARADQFGFCVALWAALYDERPFAGDDSATLRQQVLAGELAPPRTRRGPRRLLAALRRGLAREPADRWPSMTALLAELERLLRRRSWLAATAAVATAGVATALALAATSRTEHEPCPDPGPRLAGIWEPEVREAVTRAFRTASPGLADQALERVLPVVDRYAADWRATSRAACRATRVDGTQSAAILDRRSQCLDRRLRALGALTAAWTTADRQRVADAVDDTARLGDLAACDAATALATEPLPADPALRRRIEALDGELLAVAALQYGGPPAERQARASAALAEARRLDHAPVLVRALEQQHQAADARGDEPAALAALEELSQRASEAGDDRAAAEAWLAMITALSADGRFVEARTLLAVARAAVARAGAPPRLRYRLAHAVGSFHATAQEPEEALVALREAQELALDPRDRASTLQALATVLINRDGGEAALPLADEAARAAEQVYGPNHPTTAAYLQTVAQAYLRLGQLARAREVASRVLAIREATLSPESEDLGLSLHTLGTIAAQQGERAAARDFFQRAIVAAERAGSGDAAGLARGSLAELVTADQGLDAGRPLFEQALADIARQSGARSQMYVQTEFNFVANLVPDRCAEAAPHLAHVVEVLTELEPRNLPFALLISAQCDQAAGRADAAVAALERGVSMCKATPCDPPIPGYLTFELGTLLHRLGRDRGRALALVAEAEQLAAEHGTADLVEGIRAWRKHRR